MRRVSNRHLGIAIACSALAVLVLFGAAPAGACRDPGVHEACGTFDHLVLLAFLGALLCLVVSLAIVVVRLIRGG